MEKWKCSVCGYIYSYSKKIGDPYLGIKPGVEFKDIPDSWKCPICNSTKQAFKRVKKGKIVCV